MQTPFLSIIIPLYNKEKFVSATIKSVLTQTYTDFEIIIVEDCSMDNSKLIACQFISENVKIIQHEKNKGLSASRNTGIRNANSDYVVFLDADDVLKPNYLEKIFSLIQNFPEASIFATNYEEIFERKKAITTTLSLKKFEKDGIIPDFFEANLQQPLYCQSSLCVRKNAFEKIGFYDETITYSEDVDFNIRANTILKLAYSKEILVEVIKFDANQITNCSMLGKKIPDFDSYEYLATGNKSLKKYLDTNRYMFANNYKKENDLVNFRKLKNGIHPNPSISGLNYKQRILLELPVFLLKFIARVKQIFLKKGVSVSSFSK
jgi:glycosyltransferase involved in cell wall biosynthesis